MIILVIGDHIVTPLPLTCIHEHDHMIICLTPPPPCDEYDHFDTPQTPSTDHEIFEQPLKYKTIFVLQFHVWKMLPIDKLCYCKLNLI